MEDSAAEFSAQARLNFKESRRSYRSNKNAGKDQGAPYESRYTTEGSWTNPGELPAEEFRTLARRNYCESRLTYRENMGACVTHKTEPPFALDPKDQAEAAWQKPKMTPSGKPCLTDEEYRSQAKNQYDDSRKGYKAHMGVGKKETSLLSVSAKTRNPITRAEMEAGDLIGEFPVLTAAEFAETARKNFNESKRAYTAQLSNNLKKTSILEDELDPDWQPES